MRTLYNKIYDCKVAKYFMDDFLKKVQFVTIAFESMNWIQLMLSSFWKYFPDTKVLVIDNNKQENEESRWLKKQKNVIYKSNHESQEKYASKHDSEALDIAVTMIQKEFMLVIHPDCVITGTNWMEKIYEASSDDKDFIFLIQGKSIPCGSLIRISMIKDNNLSFKPRLKWRFDTGFVIAYYCIEGLLPKDYDDSRIPCSSGRFLKGGRLLHEAKKIALNDRTKFVSGEGFFHFKAGIRKNTIRENAFQRYINKNIKLY